jgi:phosphoglycolate phosphatase-like HAD superfamily hydrolase
MQRLALFDIDNTLIDAHGAGGRAVIQAIRDVYGVGGDLGDYTFHGRTDPGIIRDLAGLWGAGESAAAIGWRNGDRQSDAVRDRAERPGTSDDLIDVLMDACLVRYTALLATELADGRVDVLPGVKDLVTALAADRRVVVGLVTGNVAEGARLKLEPTGFYPLFKVGAFGSDSLLRSDLPPVAVQRAEQLTGRRFTGKEIVVIGDTPEDIRCGESLGVKAVAVATGRHTADELAAHQPDHLFPDFSDWRAAYDAVLE